VRNFPCKTEIKFGPGGPEEFEARPAHRSSLRRPARPGIKTFSGRAGPSRIGSPGRVVRFELWFLISRMRRNSDTHFTRIIVLKHPRRTIRKGNGQRQEIATISWKQYLRLEDLRFFRCLPIKILSLSLKDDWKSSKKHFALSTWCTASVFSIDFRRFSVKNRNFLRFFYPVSEFGMIVLNNSESFSCATSAILQVDFFFP